MLSFALGAVLAQLLVINEVMVRPSPGGTEWIEIFNAGDAAARLAGVTIEDARRRPVKIPESADSLEPGGYRILAANVERIVGRYGGLDPARVVKPTGTWPTLNDSDGDLGFADLVLLRGPDGTPLDSLIYFERWLGAAGTSLERVNAGASPGLASNWSPSVHDSLATPLRLNSLSLAPGQSDRGALLVPEGPMIPGGSDGPPVIGWQLDRPASVTIELFDLAGRSVRLLKPLEESAPVGRLVWNLDDDAGRPVPTGVYLVLLEGRYEGETAPRRWRRPVIVARGGGR